MAHTVILASTISTLEIFITPIGRNTINSMETNRSNHLIPIIHQVVLVLLFSTMLASNDLTDWVMSYSKSIDIDF
jgi:hypothetical protein